MTFRRALLALILAAGLCSAATVTKLLCPAGLVSENTAAFNAFGYDAQGNPVCAGLEEVTATKDGQSLTATLTACNPATGKTDFSIPTDTSGEYAISAGGQSCKIKAVHQAPTNTPETAPIALLLALAAAFALVKNKR